MIRYYGVALIFGLYLAFWIWAIFDVIATDGSRVRNLPKTVWVLFVVFFGGLGSLGWLLLGRPEGATLGIGGTQMRPGYEEPPWVQEEARRQRLAEMDAELDRRIEARRLQEQEDERRRQEREPGGQPDELDP